VKRDLFTGRRDAIDALRDVVGSGKGCRDIEALRVAMRTLRALPTIEDGLPTVALVGMPNVGKSSIVRLLSTGKPQVNVYPFTTRGLLVGHLVGEGGAVPTAGAGGGVHRRPASWRAQVMDTPGLLWRPEHREGPDYRNPIEQLTMLLLNHLASPLASPSASGREQGASGSGSGDEGEALWSEEQAHPQQPLVILFVLDPSEQCGFPLEDQIALRAHLRENFAARLARPGAGHLWMDVSNKADLEHGWRALGDANAQFAAASVSAMSGAGIPQLRALIESHGVRHSSRRSASYLVASTAGDDFNRR
jgi:GTP1/Obg family GTP-binding protein